MYYKQKNSGFTLLEMLVVVGIFSLMVVVITSILNSIFLSRKVVVARERIQSDSNSIIEIIAKDIRSSSPDYFSYFNLSYDLDNPTDVLFLVDKNDNRVAYKKANGAASCGEDGRDCLVVVNGATETDITPKGVEIADVKFYIEPAQNPFAADPSGRPDKQPFIIIVLKTEAVVGSNQGNVSNIIQTSVSSRFYQERQF